MEEEGRREEVVAPGKLTRERIELEDLDRSARRSRAPAVLDGDRTDVTSVELDRGPRPVRPRRQVGEKIGAATSEIEDPDGTTEAGMEGGHLVPEPSTGQRNPIDPPQGPKSVQVTVWLETGVVHDLGLEIPNPEVRHHPAEPSQSGARPIASPPVPSPESPGPWPAPRSPPWAESS